MVVDLISGLPDSDRGKVAYQLRRLDPSMHDDAIGEAWRAHLEGKSPAAAIVTFYRREKLHGIGECGWSQIGGGGGDGQLGGGMSSAV